MYQTQRRLQKILHKKGVQGLSNPCSEYFQRNRKHIFGGFIVLCLFALLIPSTIITTTKNFTEVTPNGELKEYKDFHNMIESGEGLAESSASPYGSCEVHNPRHPPTALNPILVATFPGSSSDLMRLLIETLTGTWTSARTFRDDVIAIKTHYPYYENHVNIKNLLENIGGEPARAILVLRDPMEALKMFHTYIEMTGNQQGESTMEEWEEWRDIHFNTQLKQWEDFIRYWLSSDQLDANTRLPVIHEKLINQEKGVEEANEIVEFIKKVSSLIDDNSADVSCLWSRVVQFNVRAEPERRRLRQLKNAETQEIVEKSYTIVQIDKIAGVLTQMIDELTLDEKVLQALMGYRISALERMQILMGDNPVLVSNTHGTCMVTIAQHDSMVPMFQASYPGSGSEMLRDLLEAITSIKTTETKRRNDVVAVKTFYPYRSFDLHPNMLNRDMKKMVLLLRYPLHAISSNFNHIYWRQNNLRTHSVQPPQELWEAWRDNNFVAEIDAWVELVEYWMDNFKAPNRLIISYESLTGKETGEQDATRLSLFIRTVYNEGTLNPAPAFTIPCLWFRAVRVYDQRNSDMFQDSSNHVGGRYRPSFNKLQLETTATHLNNLISKFNGERRIVPILQKYWEHTVNRIH
jgi:hypothetical protein